MCGDSEIRNQTKESTPGHHVNTVKWLDNLWWIYSLEVQVLESEVSFHNTSSFDSGPQHILLGGHISTVGYPVQVVQVAMGGEKRHKGRERFKNKPDVCRLRVENGYLFSQTQPKTSSCVCVSAANSLCCRVVELVLSGAAETSLNASVLPQPLDDPSQLSCHESLFCWTRQDEQLPRIILTTQSPPN